MASRELGFDACLASEKPVEGSIKIVDLGIADSKLFSQSGGVPEARSRQLRAGPHESFCDHGQDQVAFPARLGGDQRRQAELAHGTQYRLHMTVGGGALDGEDPARTDESLAAQHLAKRFDLGRGPIGKVGEGALADPLPLAPGLAQQDGGRGAAIGNVLNVHGN